MKEKLSTFAYNIKEFADYIKESAYDIKDCFVYNIREFVGQKKVCPEAIRGPSKINNDKTT